MSSAYTPRLQSFLNRIRTTKYKPSGNIFEDRLRLWDAKKSASELGDPPGCITMAEIIKNLEESIATHKIQRQWRASYYNPDYDMGIRRVERAVAKFLAD